jgi:hypothetical protein
MYRKVVLRAFLDSASRSRGKLSDGSSIPKAVGDPHDPDIDPLETREWIEALDA